MRYLILKKTYKQQIVEKSQETDPRQYHRPGMGPKDEKHLNVIQESGNHQWNTPTCPENLSQSSLCINVTTRPGFYSGRYIYIYIGGGCRLASGVPR